MIQRPSSFVTSLMLIGIFLVGAPGWSAPTQPVRLASDLKHLPGYKVNSLEFKPRVGKVLGGLRYANVPYGYPSAVYLEAPVVALADYELIRRDFAQVKDLNDREIDRWLLENATYLAESQAQQGPAGYHPIQSQVSMDYSAPKDAYRPEGYGRALIFAMPGGGYVDVKGAGASQPAYGSHANGLATLSEGIREFLMEKAISAAFEVDAARNQGNGKELKTVGTYAVIYPGFEVYGVQSPSGMRNEAAGLIVRQAHIRYTALDLVGHLGERDSVHVERILRQFGLSDTGFSQPALPYQGLNTQGASDGAIVDFGTFIAVNGFPKPLLGESGNVLLQPEEVQVDPSLQVPLNVWSETELRSRVECWADAIRDHRLTPAELQEYAAEIQGDLNQRWGLGQN